MPTSHAACPSRPICTSRIETSETTRVGRAVADDHRAKHGAGRFTWANAANSNHDGRRFDCFGPSSHPRDGRGVAEPVREVLGLKLPSFSSRDDRDRIFRVLLLLRLLYREHKVLVSAIDRRRS